MKTRLAVACGLLLAIGKPASAHRLDEYLQATVISIEQGRIEAQMRLTPGVAVFRKVYANMDTDGDGVLSAAEQRGYAERVIRDLSLMIDGTSLRLKLVAWRFPQTAEMKAGRGDIKLDFYVDFRADVPRNGQYRRLIFENHHQSRIAVYLVNCLVPSDQNIQVTAQHRNYDQSRYELDFVQAGVPSGPPPVTRRAGIAPWLGTIGLLLLAPLLIVPSVWLWRRARVGYEALPQMDSGAADRKVSQDGTRI